MKQVGYLISSTPSHSNMPSSLDFCHQPMVISHLGSFLPFSSSPSLDPYFGVSVRAQLSRHLLSPNKASENLPTPASSTSTDLPQQGHFDLTWQGTPVPCQLDCICMPQEMAQPRSLSTYQVFLDKHCPGGDGSSEEMGEHSKE